MLSVNKKMDNYYKVLGYTIAIDDTGVLIEASIKKAVLNATIKLVLELIGSIGILVCLNAFPNILNSMLDNPSAMTERTINVLTGTIVCVICLLSFFRYNLNSDRRINDHIRKITITVVSLLTMVIIFPHIPIFSKTLVLCLIIYIMFSNLYPKIKRLIGHIKLPEHNPNKQRTYDALFLYSEVNKKDIENKSTKEFNDNVRPNIPIFNTKGKRVGTFNVININKGYVKGGACKVITHGHDVHVERKED